MTKRTILKIAGYYLLLVGGMFLILVGVNWYMLKQEAVRIGMARPNFPYRQYSLEELNKMYPQYPNENVPTRQTPEETYARFIAALKAGDLESASRQFVAEKQAEWLGSLKKIKEGGLLEKMIKDLDQTPSKVNMYEVAAQYEIGVEKDGRVWSHALNFIKDSNGDWKIKSL